MKKAMGRYARLATLTLVLGSTGWATIPDETQVANVPTNPLFKLPGMHGNPSATPVTAPAPFPPLVIWDVTNAPNPFDSRKAGIEGTTQISYQLDADHPVSITIYDLFGDKVRSWQFKAGESGGRAGDNRLFWNGTNEAGQKVSKGGYLAQIEVETGTTIATVLRKIGVIH